jgi:hypothetical protein
VNRHRRPNYKNESFLILGVILFGVTLVLGMMAFFLNNLG